LPEHCGAQQVPLLVHTSPPLQPQSDEQLLQVSPD
jgi:hypothetical protein